MMTKVNRTLYNNTSYYILTNMSSWLDFHMDGIINYFVKFN